MNEHISDHIKQHVVQELFAKKVSFSWKTAKLDSIVSSEWEKKQSYRKYVTHSESRQQGTLLNCCTVCGTGQPREQPQIGDRTSNPGSGSQSVFNFFSVGSTCSRLFFIR